MGVFDQIPVVGGLFGSVFGGIPGLGFLGNGTPIYERPSFLIAAGVVLFGNRHNMSSSKSLAQNLKSGAIKGAAVALVGAVGSLLFLNGGRAVHLGGLPMPKFVAKGIILAGTTFGSQILMGKLLPTGWGNVKELQNLEMSLINPLVVSVLAVGVETLLCPEAKELTAAAGIVATYGLSVGASYLVENTGLVPTIAQANQ